MKQIKKLTLAACLIFGLSLSASADVPAGFLEKSNWHENFDNVTATRGSTTASGEITLPDGWSRIMPTEPPYTDYVGVAYPYSVPTGYIPSTNKSGGKCIGNEKGQTHLYQSSTSNYVDIYDFIISPQVKGNVKFYAYTYSDYITTPSLVEIYKATKNDDGSFSVDIANDLLQSYPLEALAAKNQWKEINYDLGNEYGYIAFRVSYAYIDEVTFDNAFIPIKKVLTLGNKKLESGTDYEADPDGNVSYKASIVVKNDGNIKLSSETEENYSLSMAYYYNGTLQDIVATVDIPDLEPNEEKTVIIEGTHLIPQDIAVNSSGEVGFNIYWVDSYNQTQGNISYIRVKPYQPIINLRYNQNTSSTLTTETIVEDKEIFLGVSQTNLEKTFIISNSGPAPLTVTSAELPEGFELDEIEFPCIVENGTPKTFKVIRKSDVIGFKSGNIKLIHNGVTIRDNMNVSGEIAPTDKFFSDFENYSGENPMSPWYAPIGSDSWSVGQYTSSPDERNRTSTGNIYWPEYNVNEGRLSNGRNNSPGHNLYSPLMKFENGDKISFYAAKRTNSGNDVKLIVSYSTDRENWTELATISVNNANNRDLQFFATSPTSPTSSGQNIPKRFEFEMPEGEYYINLTAGYVLVDNFIGGKLVDVPFDILGETSTAGKVRTVNNALDFTASFKNLNSNEVETENQTVTLYANDEAVATSNAKTIAAFSSEDFEFTYIPHVAGETNLYAELKIGDFSVKSPSITINISPESLDLKNEIGESTSTQSNLPFTYNYVNSGSELLYTAEELKDMEGTTITKLSFNYMKSDNHVSNVVKIWMENTDDTVLGSSLHDWSDSEPVFSNENFIVPASTDYTELTFVLDKPFEYEPGKSIRIRVESTNPYGFKAPNNNKYTSTATFQTTKIAGKGSLRQYNDSDTSWAQGNTTAKSDYTPIINFYTEREIEPVSGTVRDTDGQPIEGAIVKAESGEVYYETVTDDAGEWSMTIFQNTLEYTVTASAEGYATSEPVELDMEGSNDIVLTAIATSGKFNVTVTADNEDATPLAGIEVVIVSNETDAEEMSAETNESGVAEFEDLAFGEYNVSVPNAGVLFESYEHDSEVSHNADGTSLAITLTEIVYAPVSHTVTSEQAGNELYNVTITWQMGVLDNARDNGYYGYTFTVQLNDEDLETTDVTTHTLANVNLPEQKHTITVKGVSPYGSESEPYIIELDKDAVVGIDAVNADDADYRYFDLNGIEVKADELQNGIYIRTNGNKTVKIIR